MPPREVLYAKTAELASVYLHPLLPGRTEIEEAAGPTVRVREWRKIFRVDSAVERNQLRHRFIDGASTNIFTEQFGWQDFFDVRLDEMQRYPQRVNAHIAGQQFAKRERVRLHLQSVIACRVFDLRLQRFIYRRLGDHDCRFGGRFKIERSLARRCGPDDWRSGNMRGCFSSHFFRSAGESICLEIDDLNVDA